MRLGAFQVSQIGNSGGTVMQHVIGGVTVTDDDIRRAIEILQADKSANV